MKRFSETECAVSGIRSAWSSRKAVIASGKGTCAYEDSPAPSEDPIQTEAASHFQSKIAQLWQQGCYDLGLKHHNAKNLVSL